MGRGVALVGGGDGGGDGGWSTKARICFVAGGWIIIREVAIAVILPPANPNGWVGDWNAGGKGRGKLLGKLRIALVGQANPRKVEAGGAELLYLISASQRK